MNQRQMRKREKQQHNAYWDQFEQCLQSEEVMVGTERLDKWGERFFGECALLKFQVESLNDWMFLGCLKEEGQLQLCAYPVEWASEFEWDSCFFQWIGEADSFEIKVWDKWVKVIKQQPLKALVQAITGKKRLSEKQAEDWWQSYQEDEQAVREKEQLVLCEVTDYVRMLPYQHREVLSATLLEPVFLKTEKHWRTIQVFQLPIQIEFKAEVEYDSVETLMKKLQMELQDDVFQCRGYELQLIKK